MSSGNDHWCPPTHAGDVKKGQIIMLKGHPCKIVEVKTSKTGKHGHAKCNITGISVLSGKKYNEVQPSHSSMKAANLERLELSVIDCQESSFSALDEEGEVHDHDTIETLDGKNIFELYQEIDNDTHEVVVTMLKAPIMKGTKLEIEEHPEKASTRAQ